MDTQKTLHENISALADCELPDSERELAFATLATPEGQAAWRAYHLTGDVLRNTPGGDLSDGFSAALAVRLASEPAHALAHCAEKAPSDPSSPAWNQASSPADALLDIGP